MLSTRWQARAPGVGGIGTDRFVVCFAIVVVSVSLVVVVAVDSCHVVLCFGILSALALRNDRRQMEKLRGKRRLSDFVYLFSVKGECGKGEEKNCTAARLALILNWFCRIINGCTLKLED